jgi:GTP-binding protein HflX
VGFISHLPHGLVEAFRATLEETASANLLLHVVDAANEDHQEYIDKVQEVLLEIEADEVPQLQVFNKIDLLDDCQPRLQRNEQGKPVRVWLSAATGEGSDLLLQAISELLADGMVEETVVINPSQASLRSRLYEKGFVEAERVDECDGSYQMRLRLPREELARLQQEGVRLLEREEQPTARATRQTVAEEALDHGLSSQSA